MRVLQLAWEYPPHIVGGLGRHVTELVPALANDGIATTVLTPLLRGGAAVEWTPSGVEVWRVLPPRMDESNYPAFVSQTNREIERAAQTLHYQAGRFDLIHTHDWLTAEVGIALKHQWRVPLLATIHATERGRGRGTLHGWQSQRIDHMEWRLAYEAWRIVVCSRFMAQQLHTGFGTPLGKVDVVPNGVEIHPPPFVNDDERQAFRRRFVADDEALVFHVGRIVEEKGLHVLLAAWPQICAQANVRLIIAGTGAYLDALKGQAHELGISQSVTFTGFIEDDDRDRLYHVADVAVFPALYEPFGIVVLEAFAADCPVVASDTGGLPEVVHLHETGIVVHPNDATSLAWGVLHTLQNPRWTATRVANAKRALLDRYIWPKIARRTIQVYQRIAEEWNQSHWGKELVGPRR